jgi:hypothetical protein
MILTKIAHQLEIKDIELAKVLNVSPASFSIYNRMAKNPCPTILLFKLKEIYGDKICLDKIFSDNKIHKALLERNAKKIKKNKKE